MPPETIILKCRGRVMARVVLFLLACALGWGAAPAPARAHPHVWIEATTTVRFKDKKVEAIDVTWVFDEFYSADSMQDFPRTPDGKIEPKDLAALAVQSAKSLKNYGYFTRLYIGGTPHEVKAVTDFHVEMRGKILVYRFTIPVDPPVDPRQTGFGFSLYDESYFVDIELAEKNPVTLTGDVPDHCMALQAEDQKHAFYFGSVYPLVVSLTCQ